MRDLTEVAKGLGIELEDPEFKIRSEKRYTVIMELIHNNKRYVFSSGTNITDPIKAKNEVMSKITFELTKDDIITFRCIETVYAIVPIDTVLSGSTYEMQAVASKWLSPEELKELINYEATGTTPEGEGQGIREDMEPTGL